MRDTAAVLLLAAAVLLLLPTFRRRADAVTPSPAPAVPPRPFLFLDHLDGGQGAVSRGAR
jgi:hypothetical protein